MPWFVLFLTTSVILLCFFNVIRNLVVNFAYLSLTRNDLIVDECRRISSFRYMKVSYLKCLL